MADLFPLTVGDLWTYHHQEFRDDGSISLDVNQDELVRSQLVFRGTPTFEISIAGDTLKDLQRYISGTCLYVLTNANKVPHLICELFYPSAIGKTIVLSDTTTPSQYETRLIMILRSATEQVTVPAGTFSCAHFDEYLLQGNPAALDTIPLFSLYLASGVGKVSEKDYDFNASHVQITRKSDELVSYKLN